MNKKISIFGSTGSIGSTVFRILDKSLNNFKIYTLAANANFKKINNQIIKYKPEVFIIFNWEVYLKIKEKYKKKKNYNFKFRKLSDIQL